jgi:hypothetical protein
VHILAAEYVTVAIRIFLPCPSQARTAVHKNPYLASLSIATPRPTCLAQRTPEPAYQRYLQLSGAQEQKPNLLLHSSFLLVTWVSRKRKMVEHNNKQRGCHGKGAKVSRAVSKSKSKSQSHYDRQSVGQSVLVSGAHLGPATNFSFSLKFYLDSCGFVVL